MLLWTNLLRCVLMASFLLVPSASDKLLAIYGLTFAASMMSQFFAPAEGAIIPLLVRRKDLIAATSLFNLTYTGAQVAGFIFIGPTLYKLIGAWPSLSPWSGCTPLAAVCRAAARREHVAGTLRQASALGRCTYPTSGRICSKPGGSCPWRLK